MKMRWVVLLLAIASLAVPLRSKAQSLAGAEDPPKATIESSGATFSTLPDLTYTRPTEKTKLQNYFFDAYGPYPLVSAAVAAGIDQYDNSPPEWGKGAEGYGKRFGSDFGILAVSTTTRYALAEAFREDTIVLPL
jgi:hypothetical protein